MKKGFLTALLAVLALSGPAFAGGEPDGNMRVWLDADYLMWTIKDAPIDAPLLTTGTLTNPTSLGSGTLGAPSTQVLAGDTRLNQNFFSGFRLNGGWLDCSGAFGIEAGFFMLPQQTTNQSFASDATGNPLLARPVFDVRAQAETVLFVSAPNVFAGGANIASTSALFGGDLNAFCPVVRGSCDDDIIKYCNVLAGFRYLNLRENLAIDQNTTVLPNGVTFFNAQPVSNGGNLFISDNFHTLNQFYGGQVGFSSGLTWLRFTVTAAGKLGVGSMREEAMISGSTTGNSNLIPNQTVQGGLLALNSNIGSYTRNMLAVVPEGNLGFTLEITPQIKLTIGYTFLYVSNVARPGDLIDRNVDRTLVPSSQVYNPTLPGQQRPTFVWNGTDFWRRASTSVWVCASEGGDGFGRTGRVSCRVNRAQTRQLSTTAPPIEGCYVRTQVAVK